MYKKSATNFPAKARIQVGMEICAPFTQLEWDSTGSLALTLFTVLTLPLFFPFLNRLILPHSPYCKVSPSKRSFSSPTHHGITVREFGFFPHLPPHGSCNHKTVSVGGLSARAIPSPTSFHSFRLYHVFPSSHFFMKRN